MQTKLLRPLFSLLGGFLALILALGSFSSLQAQTYYFPGSNYSYTGGNNS
ncbi:MAG: hypothetical protein JST06_10200 [Bacteroidetes bacterium]|nr:hypothetical protein [Bacteroidota bacterium]